MSLLTRWCSVQEEMLEAKVQGQVSRFRLMGNIPVADREGGGMVPSAL